MSVRIDVVFHSRSTTPMIEPFSLTDIETRTAPTVERVIDTQAAPDEARVDLALRPGSLDDFIGQERLKRT